MNATKALVLGGCYIVCSSAMIIVNKMLMQKDHFPYASCLVMMHMCGAFVLASLLLAVRPACFPSAPEVFGKWSGASPGRYLDYARPFLPFVPIGMCGALAFVTSNMAYAYASVSFLQIMKEAHVVIVYGLSVLVGLDTLRFRNVVVLTMIVFSASVAIYGEIHFVWKGFWLQLISGMSECVRIVATNVMMSKAGSKVDPLTMVLCTAPPTMLALAPAVIARWDPLIPLRAVRMWPQLCVSVLLAFLLQVSIAMAIRGLSGTGLALSSVMKDLVIVVSSCVFLHEYLTTVQIIGFLFAVLGIGIYSAMKQFPEWFSCRNSGVPSREQVVLNEASLKGATQLEPSDGRPQFDREDTVSTRSSEKGQDPSQSSGCVQNEPAPQDCAGGTPSGPRHDPP